jgi:competence protein ComEC
LSLVVLFGFILNSGYEKWRSFSSQKLIIYNVAQHQAIDFISGNNFRFIGDSLIHEKGTLQDYLLKPARIALRLDNETHNIPGLYQQDKFFLFHNKKLLLIDSQVVFEPIHTKISIDYIILSKNPVVSIPNLFQTFDCKQFIIDASNSLWKIGKWKKDFERLHLPFYSVPEQGAFIIEI